MGETYRPKIITKKQIKLDHGHVEGHGVVRGDRGHDTKVREKESKKAMVWAPNEALKNVLWLQINLFRVFCNFLKVFRPTKAFRVTSMYNLPLVTQKITHLALALKTKI